ncbi:MAG: response regulator transcription factor [Cyanobacteria bacterium HKST-UBA02]|nr:response regulator transcription factor [Cyanobacteria bacterium HKST-UBA02]
MVEDQRLLRVAVSLILERHSDIWIIGESDLCKDAARAIVRKRPAVVLMDVELPDGSGITLTEFLRRKLPEIRILMFTSDFSRETLIAAARAGADGYCLKNAPPGVLVEAIRTVAKGENWLDPRLGNDFRCLVGKRDNRRREKA